MPRIQPWLVSYGLLGMIQVGLVPVLLPLVAPRGTDAGLTFAAFSLPGVFAPFVGAWADGNGRHRDLLIGGCVAAGVLLPLFDVVATSPLRTLLSIGAGFGATAAMTAGNILAVQGFPQEAWDDRVALLQRCVSAGQVIGLGLAGMIAGTHPDAAFILAGVALLAAAALAAVSAPRSVASDAAVKLPPKPMTGGDAGVMGPHHRGHHLPWRQIGTYLNAINRPVRRFLSVWLATYAAMNGFAALFPVAMTRQFGMAPILPASAYAIGVAASLQLYALAGSATHRLGGARMLAAGFAARLLPLGLLAASGILPLGTAGWLALAGFALIQFVWPLIAVAANSLSVRLSPTARGEGVGLFNAATALASAIGATCAGFVYDAGGMVALSAATFAAVLCGLLLVEFWLRRALAPIQSRGRAARR